MEFYINKNKSAKILYIYYGILVVFVAMLLFSSGLVTEDRSTKGIAISSVSIIVLTIVLIKANLARRDTSPMVVLDAAGITSRTTPMSKAAGLIRWEDITDVYLNKVTGDTLITLSLQNAESYMVLMRKKMPAFALKDMVTEDGILTIHLTAAELDVDAAELFNQITAFAGKRAI